MSHASPSLLTTFSLQSALYHHGMIFQIPSVTYAVSLARPRRYETPLGVFSIHHLEPHFFFGYETEETGSAKIAIPEKALLDLCYLRPARTRLFVELPEIQFSNSFDWNKASRMARKIRSHSRRVLVEQALSNLRKSGKTTLKLGKTK